MTGSDIDPGSYYSLGSHTNTHFAYDLGAGVQLGITEHLNASLDYVYTNLGNMFPSGTSRTNVALTSPPMFKIYSQTVLLGISWKV